MSGELSYPLILDAEKETTVTDSETLVTVTDSEFQT